MDESKPLVQDLVAAPPNARYLEDLRYRREHGILAAAVAVIFLALAAIAVVFSLRPEDDGVPIYGAVPGGIPPPEESPDTPDKIVKDAILAFKSGEKDRASQLLAGVDLAQAASPPAWELAGMLKADAGDRQAAMEIYSRGIAAAPSEGLFYRRAILHRDIGELDLALDDMDRATARPPVHALLSNERLLLLLQMGRIDQARAELQALNARNADPAGWIFGLCGMALQNGEYQQAGRLLASAKQSADPAVFQQILNNPALSRHQFRPELMPFYFSNLPK
jgi:tetratricopeptide (TPR) repeat protein